MKVRLLDIYKKFTHIGMILIGGGYVILPILKEQVVNEKKWITENELVDYYAISQSLPGLIAANISIFIGYKLRGKMGALVSTLGLITAPFICISLLAGLLLQISDSTIFKSILWGIGIGVIILIISSVQELWSKAITDRFSLLLFFCFLVAILNLKITPTPIILSSILIGIIYKSVVKKIKRSEE